MGKIKDLKNHKIKTIVLWPRVILMTLFFCAFATILVFLLVVYSEKVVASGLYDSDNVIKNILLEYDSTKTEAEQEAWAQNVQKLMPKVKGISIIDENGSQKKILVETFDFTKYENIRDIADDKPYSASAIYYSKDKSNFIEVNKRNNNIEFNYKIWWDIIQTYINNQDENGEIAYSDMWFVYDIAGTNNKFAVEYHYSVSVYDVVFIFLAAAAVVVMFIILTLYHIISFINLFNDKRHVYNALFVDMVTGGKNWLWFKGKALMNIKSTKRGKRNFVIIQLRVEKYRSYCAVNGVKAGEQLVEDLYKRLNELLDKREVGVHYERADFAIMLLFQTEATMKMRLEMLINALDFVRETEKLYFSLGVVMVTDYKQTPEDLYNLAGVARSTISEESSNRIVWYNEKMAEERAWDNMVENEMQNALDSGQFRVFLQPKYTPKKEALGGAEALIRWQRPGEERLVPPGRFIPLFERNGFITKIDDFMISEIARLQSKWLSLGYKIVPVSVNLSRVHFSMPNLAEHILHLVDQYETPHEYIELELTESAFFDDKKALLEVVDKLHEYGFKVSMDDFGAGYSSLNSLKELPLDVIKIDAEFFRHVENEERSNQIVRATINLAKQLKMDVVAEGVEERAQVDFLATTRCDLIQGYYFAKPMPNEDYEKIFADMAKPKKKTKKTE